MSELVTDDVKVEDTLLDEAWRILCNVSEGDWSQQTQEWQEAVLKFREKYHADLDQRLRGGEQQEETD